MKYTLNQYGVVKKEGEVVPMEENSPLYKDYVKFLKSGGTIEDVIEKDVIPPSQTFKTKSKTNRLITKESAIQIHDQAIEDILNHLEVIQNRLDRAESEKQLIKGISGSFKSLDGKTITIKNGIIKSITIKNK